MAGSLTGLYWLGNQNPPFNIGVYGGDANLMREVSP